jgi:hypothetical protein
MFNLGRGLAMVAHMRLVNYAAGVKKRQEVDADTVMIERRHWITREDVKDEWRRIHLIHDLDPGTTDREESNRQVLAANERERRIAQLKRRGLG